jgi:hypothetical protein
MVASCYVFFLVKQPFVDVDLGGIEMRMRDSTKSAKKYRAIACFVRVGGEDNVEMCWICASVSSRSIIWAGVPA